MKDTQNVEWTRPDSEPGFIECIGKTPIEYQSHTQTTPKDNANYGSGISLSRNAQLSVTSAPSFNYNTDFDVGETNLQVRNSSYQGPPIVLPITETLLPSSFYGSFIFISEDGSTVVSNAHGYDASNGGGLGALFIHKEIGGVWTQVATILSLDVDTEDGLFGFQMSISGDGNRILVTAPTMGAINRGKAFMLDTSNGWATFTSAPFISLNLPDQTRFGHNCWLSSNGQTAFVGALEPDASGAVYVFEQREGAWSQIQKLTASNSAANAYFGAATVDLTALDRLAGNSIASSSNGGQLIIGSPGAVVNAASDQGIVYHFTRSGGDSWVETQLIPLPIEDAVNETIFFGFSVGMSANGSRIVVGVPRSFLISGPFFTGKIAFYQLCVDGFELIQSTRATSPQGFEYSGTCVAISPDGQFAASGAIEYDDKESGQGRVLYYDFDFPFSAPPVIPPPIIPPPIIPPPIILTYDELIISDGPISYYRLGESSNSDPAIDEMGVQNGAYMANPTMGVPGLVVGDSDTAVDFTTGNKYVVMSDNNSYSFTDGISDKPFSFEAIIVVTGQSVWSSPILSKSEDTSLGGNQNEYAFVVENNGVLSCYIYNGVTGDNHRWFTTGGTIQLNTRYHVICTYGGSQNTGQMYVDADEKILQYTVVGVYTGMTNTTSSLKLGMVFLNNNSFETPFEGVLDKVAIYNYVLTPAQIQAHYDKGIGI